jgi:hypothetical protein
MAIRVEGINPVPRPRTSSLANLRRGGKPCTPCTPAKSNTSKLTLAPPAKTKTKPVHCQHPLPGNRMRWNYAFRAPYLFYSTAR